MEFVKLTAGVAAIVTAAVAAAWSTPAHPAEPAPAAVQAVAAPQAAPAPATPAQGTLPAARGVASRRINAAASAASGTHDDADVHTTTNDGRTTTRNAHERNQTSAASAPNE